MPYASSTSTRSPSSVVFKVDFDRALLVLASALYRAGRSASGNGSRTNAMPFWCSTRHLLRSFGAGGRTARPVQRLKHAWVPRAAKCLACHCRRDRHTSWRSAVSRGLLWNWRSRVRRGVLKPEPTSVFVPVQVVSEPAPAERSEHGGARSEPASADGKIDITLADGTGIRVGPDVSLVMLRRVIAVLRG
jgi:hypothetical protein